MKLIPLKNLTVRVPATLIDAVQQAAEEHKMTISELVRYALQAQLDLDPAAQRHASVMFEIVKTRAVLLGYLEESGFEGERVEGIVDEAEKAAKEYLKEQGGEAAG
jgi:hypothetical protein